MKTGMKPGGVAWIGDIPAEWEVKRLKYLISEREGGAWGQEPAEDKGDVICIRVADFNYPNNDIFTDNLTIRNYDTQTIKRLLLKKGDMLIEKSGGGENMPVGRTIIFQHKTKAVFSNFIERIRLKDNSHPSFVQYLFVAMYQNDITKQYIKQTTGIQNLDLTTMLSSVIFPVPVLSEQQAIAAFLDAQCSHIDSIITETERKIELLRQYKTSRITETVTKGLDKAIPMKDSGIDWIGKIPAHWEVKKIRYLGNFQNGISKDGEYFGTGYPFVSYGDVYNNMQLPSLVDGRIESSRKERILYSVKKGDVFFTRTSETIEEIGFSSICTETIIDATFAGFLIRFRPNAGGLDIQFSKFYFQADLLRAFFVKEMMIVTRASLPQSLLKNLWVVLPPIMEQKKIGDFLTSKCTIIDSIITQKQQSIETMKAYKKSLIYEYVTGKRRV
jgi:type I restriction enzyme S subunit